MLTGGIRNKVINWKNLTIKKVLLIIKVILF